MHSSPIMFLDQLFDVNALAQTCHAALVVINSRPEGELRQHVLTYLGSCRSHGPLFGRRNTCGSALHIKAATSFRGACERISPHNLLESCTLRNGQPLRRFIMQVTFCIMLPGGLQDNTLIRSYNSKPNRTFAPPIKGTKISL